MNSHGQDKFYRTIPTHFKRVYQRQKSRSRLVPRGVPSLLELHRQGGRRIQLTAGSRQDEKHFCELYDFAPTGYLTFSSTGVIKELNLKVCAYLGLSRMEIVERNFLDFVVDGDSQTFRNHIQEVFRSSHSVHASLQITQGDGTLMDIAMESVRWRDELDGTTVIRSNLHDLRNTRALEKELLMARDHAQSTSEAKSQFLAHMSHEMRTPLGVIIGFTDLLRDDKCQSDLKQGLDTIHRNGIHLLSLVDDLLDMAKIEAGQMKMEILPFHLRLELLEIVNQFEVNAREKGVALSINLTTPLPDKILTDPVRFRQILLNILSNALKFTAEGSIAIEVSLLPQRAPEQDSFEQDPPSLLCIDIMDSGEGIDAEEAQILFQPFIQAEASTARRHGGTGLGLCLSRGLAKALGGNVELLSSEKGRGSTFRVTIDPYTSPDASGCSLDNKKPKGVTGMLRELPSLEGLKILVVEDGMDNQVMIKTLLETVGADVECVEDGGMALGHVKDGTYDVILMDLQLPTMDGYAATNELRRCGFEIPIIALTAHALVEDRVRVQAGGFDDFISKPIDWFKLTEAILRCHNVKPMYH